METIARKFIISVVMSLVASPVTASEQLTANQLMQKFQQALESSKSYIIKAEYTDEHDTYFDEKHPDPSLRNYKFKGTLQNSIEVRYDGEHVHYRQYEWGNISRLIPSASREEAAYRCMNYADGELYRHSMQLNDVGTGGSVHLNKPKYYLPGGTEQKIMGYCIQSRDRVDVALSKAKSISVRPVTENIGGSDCYVIDAQIDCGKITVWIDPDHGYHIAKADCIGKQANGDLFFGMDMVDKEQVTHYQYEVKRFEQIDGVWIPMEVEDIMENTFHPGDYSKDKIYYKRTEIQLNPDHDALGSFDSPLENPENDPELINGIRVAIAGVPINFIWEDGELIADIDEAAIAQLDKLADNIMRESISEIMTVSQLLEKYSETQEMLKSFIAKADSTIESVDISAKKEEEQSEFRTDGRNVNHRSTTTDKSSVRETSTYSSFLWDGESLTQYKSNLVLISKVEYSKKRLIATEYKGAPLLGIFGGDTDRIDMILSKADDAILQPKKETIGNSQCYLVEANTTTGNYKIWFDPQHGYNVAKAEIQRSDRTGVTSFSMHDVFFEQINGVWIPMEAEIQQTENGKSVKWHHKRIEILLNPDHIQLKSFVADDIPEGTKVSVSGESSRDYIWQNGKAVKEVINNAGL